MLLQAKKLTDHGLFTDYRPDPETLPAGYRERAGLLAFAKDEQGRDFYEHVYGWTGDGYTPVTGRTFVYVEQASERVAQVVHDDVDVFPPARTMLSHPVQNGVSFRLLSFTANHYVVPGMIWNERDGFAPA